MCALLLAAMNLEVSFTPSLCFPRHLPEVLFFFVLIAGGLTVEGKVMVATFFSFLDHVEAL